MWGKFEKFALRPLFHPSWRALAPNTENTSLASPAPGIVRGQWETAG
jgi:hypothetical protein